MADGEIRRLRRLLVQNAMPEVKRLFVALDPPAEVRRQVAEWLSEARETLPAARWTRADAYHLTLAFLGDTAAQRLGDLEQALAEAFAASPPQRLRIAGGGGFPPRGAARVIWLGIEAGEGLARLAERVDRAVRAVTGAPADRRPFRAHLTVARPRPPWSRSAVERFRQRARRWPGAGFTASRGFLYESELRRDGARYRRLGEYPLGAGARAC